MVAWWLLWRSVFLWVMSEWSLTYHGHKGGYNLDSNSVSALAVTKVLLGEAPDQLPPLVASDEGTETVWLVAKEQSKYWKSVDPRACEPREGTTPFVIFLKSNKATQIWEISLFRYPVSKVMNCGGIMLILVRNRNTQSASTTLPIYRTFNDADSFTTIRDGATYVCSSFVQVGFNQPSAYRALNLVTAPIYSRTRHWLFSFMNCIFFPLFPFWSNTYC